MSILRQLRTAAGLSQEKLAEMAGASQSQIDRLEKGQRKLTVDWATKLAKHVGVEPKALLGFEPDIVVYDKDGNVAQVIEVKSTEQAPVTVTRGGFGATAARVYGAQRPPGGVQAPAQMPVRAACRGGVDQEMFLEDGPIDWVAKPDYLKNARDPYAMYVVGDSMMPRFRPAQLLHINPHKPPAPGAGVVLVKKSKAILVKEFVRYTPVGDVVLREYQPQDREFTVTADDVDVLHTVVGLQEP